MKVLVGTITSQSLTSQYRKVISKAAVALLTATQYFVPMYSLNSFSNFLVYGPSTSRFDFKIVPISC